MTDFRPVKRFRKKFSVYVTEDILNKLNKVADDEGLSRSSLVNQMIEHYLTRKRENPYRD